MATDVAEFVGAALGLNLLFGLALLPAGLVTAVVAFAVLGLQQRGREVRFPRFLLDHGAHRGTEAETSSL
jgi:Mn2+/Fe2+ NRAMP family transporter